MSFSTDVAALKARADSLRTDRNATLTQLSDALFNRLRPLAALDWMTDDALHQASRAFADSAMRTLDVTAPLP